MVDNINCVNAASDKDFLKLLAQWQKITCTVCVNALKVAEHVMGIGTSLLCMVEMLVC